MGNSIFIKLSLPLIVIMIIATFGLYALTSSIVIIPMVISIIVILATLFFTVQSFMSVPLSTATSAIKALSDGNLSTNINATSGDEMGKLLKNIDLLTSSLREVFIEINETNSQISTSAVQLSDVVVKSNNEANKQNQEIEQVIHSLQNMSSTVDQIATNTAEASQTSTESQTEAQNGRSIVSTTISEIQTLVNDVENATQVIQTLEKDSENIGGVLDVIKGIADQTNLLALNAAIEAARAGEQGRGFAVVAEEVRTLAQRTQESTSEIEQMIEQFQSRSREAVAAMIEGGKHTQSSVEQAELAGKSLNSITSFIEHIKQITEQIANSAEEQTVAASEVSQNMEVIKVSASDNADHLSSVSSASENLIDSISSLQTTIKKLNI
ncbi:MAG: methyl-accepting chemotaxis protein [Methylococcales bacterium]|jgi:methyl-accepting chemotaxis protein|nr:methyl-accepting chemotaxis protein [Methylococcales bacterium]